MRNIWLVIKHDVGVTVRQRSFWIFTLLVPALLLAVNAYTIIERGGLSSTDQDADSQEATSASLADLPALGLVDEADLIAEMPPGIPPDLFVRFPDEAAARAALEAGEIKQYIHLPADYVATGEITVYDQGFQLFSTGENMGVAFASNQAWILPYVINYNLVGDQQLLDALQNPVPSALAEFHALQPPAQDDTEIQAMAELVASVMPYIYYFLLVMGSSYLMRSVVAEKENRTAEVLLLSLNPLELMIGKMLAMSLVMWLQVVVWVGGGILILDRGAEVMNMARFTFPPGFLAWALGFLVCGYLLFASVMAAAGAIAPTAREGAQVTWLLILPLMPTLMFGPAFVEDPNGTLSVVLSLFPFSAPSAMVTRLAVAQVPLWQILVSLAGLAATAYLFVVLAARFFRSGNLLSDESFNWRRMATGWRRAS
jgi:ABC-2 type transport system permease protein